MKKLIAAMVLLNVATVVAHANEEDITDKYCSAHADMTSRVFEVRKVEGVNLDSFIAQIEASGKSMNSRTKSFITHAYNVSLKLSKKQVFDSAYELCYSTYDGLIAKK